MPNLLTGLAIQGYRCFKQFQIDGLAQVSLLVGRNSSGKTALLEAVELLCSPGYQLQRLWAPLSRRGESFPGDETRNRPEYDIAHLFWGHEIHLGLTFEITGHRRSGDEFIHGAIIPRQIRGEIIAGEPAQTRLFPEGEMADSDLQTWRMGLKLTSTGPEGQMILPLTPRGGLRWEMLRESYRGPAPDDRARDVTFITTDSLDSDSASRYWKSIALTPEEDLVVQALRVVDPEVERVAFVGPSRPAGLGSRGGLLVKHRNVERPFPIGSLGDGMWRMFCIAIGLARARGGVLLVDEIDTGLHYSVMEEMWRMVLQTAERLNVQVLATTHSNDCINSLANVCHEALPGKVSLQRIDAEKPRAVAYSEEEIWMAARHGIEVR